MEDQEATPNILLNSLAEDEQPSMNDEQHQSQRLKAEQTNEEMPLWKQYLSKILEHWAFTTWMTALTIYALFGDDLRLLATPKSADEVFYSISVVCLFFFAFEVVVASLVKENYWLGFFFWLDVIATVSLIPDIAWIWDPIVQDDSAGTDTAQASQLARAGRASRAGTRAGRIIRIIRIIRLIRIVKLYKLAQEAKDDYGKDEAAGQLQRATVIYRGGDVPVIGSVNNNMNLVDQNEPGYGAESASASQSFDRHFEEANGQKQPGPEPGQAFLEANKAGAKIYPLPSVQKGGINPEVEEENEEFKVPEESKVGRKLSELTTKRVIILVLGMMFGLPLFTVNLYEEENTSFEFGLELINTFIAEPLEFKKAWDIYVDEHEDIDTPLVYLQFKFRDTYESDTNYQDLRSIELQSVVIEDQDDDDFYVAAAIFDLRANTRLQAALNMARTVFVCIVLAVSSILFSKDANDLVLGPIENMMDKVNKISKNPLEAVQEEEKEAVARQMALEENPDLAKEQTKKSDEGPMETAVLEQTIIKIGALLALGFGEAGSEIIATNMQKGGGEVEPMVPGRKTYCIFGFCDIRNFTDATEVLQEGVMVFVNEIAKIVHSIVDHYSGAANKNIGDAFLLVWKFPDECLEESIGMDKRKNISVNDSVKVTQIADMSVISFLKIMAAINKDPTILKYRENEGLKAVMPNYKVQMGFGLHVGWAIEGAIGSEFKIDASYLSPNVNMASRLEAATKQYGVPLLVSGAIFRLFSRETKMECRQIDRVTVKGSTEPIEIYTCDIDTSTLRPESSRVKEVTDKKLARVTQRTKRDRLRKEALEKNIPMSAQFNEDEDLRLMKSTITPEFIKSFQDAFQHYIRGNWVKAKEGLMLAESINGAKDGPSQTILGVIEEYGGEAPGNWDGYRELTEK